MKKLLLKVKYWTIVLSYAAMLWGVEIAWLGLLGWLLVKTLKG